MKPVKFYQFAFYAIPPIILFLAFWWIFVFHVDDAFIPYLSLLGLFIGLIFSFIISRRIKNIYSLPKGIIIFSYLFYNLCFLGFFMGVPVFNLILSPLSGYYMGKRKKDNFWPAVIFTTAILLLVCLASGYLALSDPYTSQNLNGMLSLHFTFTRNLLLMITTTGTIVILALHYVLYKYFFNKAFLGKE